MDSPEYTEATVEVRERKEADDDLDRFRRLALAMAITTLQLAAEMRLGDGVTPLDEPLSGILERLHDTAVHIVERRAPDAPASVQDEATVRLAAYLYDQPNAGMGSRFSFAWQSSGASALCAPFRIRRTGHPTPAPPATPNP